MTVYDEYLRAQPAGQMGSAPQMGSMPSMGNDNAATTNGTENIDPAGEEAKDAE